MTQSLPASGPAAPGGTPSSGASPAEGGDAGFLQLLLSALAPAAALQEAVPAEAGAPASPAADDLEPTSGDGEPQDAEGGAGPLLLPVPSLLQPAGAKAEQGPQHDPRGALASPAEATRLAGEVVLPSAASASGAVTPQVEAAEALAAALPDASEATLSSPATTTSSTDPAAPALVAGAQAPQPPSAAAEPAPVRQLQSPPGTPAWRDELGGELAWMAQNGRESASLRLTPEHLGPIEVRITVRDGEASVWFGAAHPDTRAALEQAMPRLRELFASQGLTLADSGVFREPPPERHAAADAPRASSAAPLDELAGEPAPLTHTGLVDLYA